MPLRLSQALGITTEQLDATAAVDLYIDVDTPLHLDPYLLRTTGVPELGGAYDVFNRYFGEVFVIAKSCQSYGDRSYRALVQHLRFGEVPYVGLGYSQKRIKGSGIGIGIAEQLARTTMDIVRAGINDPVVFELIGLFEEGVGADRISDMTISIILERLLDYSVRVATEIKSPTGFIRYKGKEFYIPYIAEVRRPLILIPKDLLRDLPVAESWSDIDEVCRYNEDLRAQVNNLIGSTWKEATRIPKKELKKVLIENPEVLIDLIRQYKAKRAKAYD